MEAAKIAPKATPKPAPVRLFAGWVKWATTQSAWYVLAFAVGYLVGKAL